MRCLFLISIGIIYCVFNAQAQQLFSGRVFEEKTRVPLAGIKVENTRNKKSTQTDINGKFKLDAVLNDVLVFNGFAYYPDTILIIKFPNADFFMLPRKNLLKEVQVTGQEYAGSLKVYDRDFHNQAVQYLMDDYGNYKGGIAIRIWSNKAQERKRKKLDKLAFNAKWEAIIDTAFSTTNLARLVPLKGEELDAFALMYRPKAEQYASNNFNLLDYVNACYKKFTLLPVEKRKPTSLPKSPQPSKGRGHMD